jgi:NAD(P)-dependent dehydrogenase (short-subunit alcohol dehydrogenase family)
MELKDKVAVVTGAAGDIGLAAVRRLVESGASTMLIDIDRQALADAVTTFARDQVAHCVVNVTCEADLEAGARETYARFGKVDILFVNAGVEQPHIPITSLPESAFDRVVAVNLKGVFLTIKHFLPIMAEGGSIIIMSSIAGLMGIPAYAAYSASKAGLIGMMRSIALDAAPRGIRCNTIHPGSVRSRMLDRSAHEVAGDSKEEWCRRVSAMAKLGRLVEPEEVADLVVFLGGDSSRMITGQSIAIDGGTII